MKPECSRCKAKGVECRYIAKSAKVARKGTRSRRHESDEQLNGADASFLTPSSLENFAETSFDNVANGDGALIASPSQVTNTGESANWHMADIDFNQLLSPTMNKNLESSYPNLELFDDYGSIFDPSHSINWAIPPQPASARLLKPRQNARPDVQRTTTLIHRTLKSYLLTMLHQNSLPPFIHQNMTSTALEMEALDNCITLVHMLSSGSRGSRKLFWKNVQMECERICCEVCKDRLGQG